MDGRRVLIATKLDVLKHGGVDASVPEGADGIDFGRTLLLNLNALNSMTRLDDTQASSMYQLTEKSRVQLGRDE